jgi:small conductance mechanosensitive channel
VPHLSATSTPPPSSLLGNITLTDIAIVLITVVIAIAVERIITAYLSRFAKRARLQAHTTNNLILVTRILILLVAVAALIRNVGAAPEWILSISAIGGAALGFASQKTLGNFLAGLFLLSARPFKVGDYVRLGTVEGLVQEITLNYTRVLTMANNIVSVTNLQILDRDITNFANEIHEQGRQAGIYCYTFEIGFDHSVSTPKIGQIFEDIFTKYAPELPKKPACTLIRSDALNRVYLVYLYVRKPEDISKYRAKVIEDAYSSWDEKRTSLKSAT